MSLHVVNIDGPEADSLNEGKATVLGIVLYNFEEDKIVMFRANNHSGEEVVAMLAKCGWAKWKTT